jgi:hypothetical protein
MTGARTQLEKSALLPSLEALLLVRAVRRCTAMLEQTVGCLLPIKVKSNDGVHLGQLDGRLFRLDLLRPSPGEEGLNYRIDRDAGSRNPVSGQWSCGTHESGIRAFRGGNFGRWTMPNTMPGFCIEALRPVATPGIDFVANPFSSRNM